MAASSSAAVYGRKSGPASGTLAQLADNGDDCSTVADRGAMPDGAPPFVGRQVVMRRRAHGRALIGGAVQAEHGGKPVQFVDIVGEQVAPFAPAPTPDRVIDIDRHRCAPRSTL